MFLLRLLFKLPGLASAVTWLKAFKVECLYLAIAAFLAGAAVSGYTTHKITRAFDRTTIAEARQELADWKTAAAQERIDAANRNAAIMKAAKSQYDEQMAAITGLSGDLKRIAAGVSVCTSVSTLRVPASPVGPSSPAEGGESRRADVVLQELAAEFARRADSNAAAYNSLMERWEKVAAK